MKGLPSGPVTVPTMEAPSAVALMTAASGSAARTPRATRIKILPSGLYFTAL